MEEAARIQHRQTEGFTATSAPPFVSSILSSLPTVVSALTTIESTTTVATFTSNSKVFYSLNSTAIIITDVTEYSAITATAVSTKRKNSTSSGNSTGISAAGATAGIIYTGSKPSTSTLVIAVVVPVVVVALLAALGAFCFMRRRRRKRAIGNTELSRAESTAFRKPELEGTPGTTRFESEPKPELEATPKHKWSRRSRRGAELDGTPKEKRSARYRKGAVDSLKRDTIYQEKEAVQPPQAVLSEVPELPAVREYQPVRHSTDQIRSAPTDSSQSASANEETNLLRMGPTKRASPTYSATTESSPQAQAAVDASQINKLKAQERELAEYIEAHETLQKLKNEHIALQERIKAAEERAQRSKVGGAD